jgi:hypothetical protein
LAPGAPAAHGSGSTKFEKKAAILVGTDETTMVELRELAITAAPALPEFSTIACSGPGNISRKD